MKNEYLISFILLSLAGMCVGLINYAYPNEYLELFLNMSHGAFLLSSIYFFYANGTYRNTTYFKWSTTGFGLIMLSVVLRNMHWDQSHWLSFTGFLLLLFFYTLHFIKKPIREELDWIKVIFIYVYISLRCLNLFFTYFPNSIYFITDGILLYALFIFFYKPSQPSSNVLDEE